MHRALVGDLEEARALVVGERPQKLHVPVDAVQHPLPILAGGAVRSVNLGVHQVNFTFSSGQPLRRA